MASLLRPRVAACRPISGEHTFGKHNAPRQLVGSYLSPCLSPCLSLCLFPCLSPFSCSFLSPCLTPCLASPFPTFLSHSQLFVNHHTLSLLREFSLSLSLFLPPLSPFHTNSFRMPHLDFLHFSFSLTCTHTIAHTLARTCPHADTHKQSRKHALFLSLFYLLTLSV